MKMRTKLGAMLGAGALAFALFGTALAAAPGATEQGVLPVLHDGANITAAGGGNNDAANCALADTVEIGGTSGDGTSTNGVTVHMVYGPGEGGEQDNEVDFTVDNGVVTIAYIKGGNGYNSYDYTGMGGVAWDNDLYSPVNGSGNPAGLSHAVFCTGLPSVTASSSSSESSSFTDTVSGTTDSSSSSSSSSSETTSFTDTVSDTTNVIPSEPNTATIGSTDSSSVSGGFWMLIAGLGALGGSVLVLLPARAKNRK